MYVQKATKLTSMVEVSTWLLSTSIISENASFRIRAELYDNDINFPSDTFDAENINGVFELTSKAILLSSISWSHTRSLIDSQINVTARSFNSTRSDGVQRAARSNLCTSQNSPRPIFSSVRNAEKEYKDFRWAYGRLVTSEYFSSI